MGEEHRLEQIIFCEQKNEAHTESKYLQRKSKSRGKLHEQKLGKRLRMEPRMETELELEYWNKLDMQQKSMFFSWMGMESKSKSRMGVKIEIPHKDKLQQL